MPSLAQVGMEVHLDEIHTKFDYHDLDRIFKVMAFILIVVEMVSAQYLDSLVESHRTSFCLITDVLLLFLVK